MNNKIDMTFVTAFIFMILFATATVVMAAPLDRDDYIEVTIEKGDTLWGLAQEYKESHVYSPEEFIDWVTDHNAVERSAVYPGQKILIPVEKD